MTVLLYFMVMLYDHVTVNPFEIITNVPMDVITQNESIQYSFFSLGSTFGLLYPILSKTFCIIATISCCPKILMNIKWPATFPGLAMSFYCLIELVFQNGICIFYYGKIYVL